MTKIHPPSSTFDPALEETVKKLAPGTYALAGGLAVSNWIPTRRTQDLDFVILARQVDQLKKLFPRCLNEGPSIYSTRIMGIHVDFLKPTAYGWNQKAIRHAQVQRIEKVKLPVITPEYLILSKLHTERRVDLEDVISLLRLPAVYSRAQSLVERSLSPQHAVELDQLSMYPY